MNLANIFPDSSNFMIFQQISRHFFIIWNGLPYLSESKSYTFERNNVKLNLRNLKRKLWTETFWNFFWSKIIFWVQTYVKLNLSPAERLIWSLRGLYVWKLWTFPPKKCHRISKILKWEYVSDHSEQLWFLGPTHHHHRKWNNTAARLKTDLFLEYKLIFPRFQAKRFPTSLLEEFSSWARSKVKNFLPANFFPGFFHDFFQVFISLPWFILFSPNRRKFCFGKNPKYVPLGGSNFQLFARTVPKQLRLIGFYESVVFHERLKTSEKCGSLYRCELFLVYCEAKSESEGGIWLPFFIGLQGFLGS